MKIGILTSEVSRRVRELGAWFHNMDLAGVKTAPDHALGDYPSCQWQRVQHVLPRDLSGKSVLDIGCNAGFYTIELKRRGAGRTLGVDVNPRHLAQAELAAEVCGVDVEFLKLSVYELAVLRERFDIVLFMGALCQLRHPLLALDILHEHVVADTLIFQSTLYPQDAQSGSSRQALRFDSVPEPQLHFIERRDPDGMTNWWVPTGHCAEAMLRSSGFRIVENPDAGVYSCRRAEARPFDGYTPPKVWVCTGGPRGEPRP